jgi:D-alanyl-D-alanine carboxypeptidase (penicillin-binding protein 5/6)
MSFVSISIKRWLWLGAALLVLGFLFGVAILHPLIIPTTSRYARHEGFPPLIYLPNYDQGPKVLADAAILVEAANGAVLYAKNEHRRRAPASTTKMMTAIVVLEKANLRDIVMVSKKAARTGGSSLHLKPGDRVPITELLQGVMMVSGNDGSVALAEHVAGSVGGFADLMNRRALELGALNTRFQNPHGLRAPSHYTTAFDLAIIARYALAYPLFSRYVSTREEEMNYEQEERVRPLRNTNRLLWSFAGADGVKTGTTNEAGYCLVASACREGRRFIAVVLHSPDRWGDCTRLLEYGFSEFSLHRLAKVDQPCLKVEVDEKKPKRKVEIYPRRDLTVVMRHGDEGKLQRFVTTYPEALRPPIRKGKVVGRVGYSYQGSEVEGVDLIIRKNVPRRGLFGSWR